MNPEAIEAAANQLKSQMRMSSMDDILARKRARMILLAAGPYLIRDARADELEAAADRWDVAIPENYVSVFAEGIRQCAKSLRARAAAIRAGEA